MCIKPLSTLSQRQNRVLARCIFNTNLLSMIKYRKGKNETINSIKCAIRAVNFVSRFRSYIFIQILCRSGFFK